MTPRVSFVAALRDPSYGGDLPRRVEIFLNGIVTLANRNALDAEVILVEWNTPSEARPLRELLTVRQPLGSVSVRIIVVPPRVHQSFPNGDKIPFFEPIAKNAALRRARGDYWLATNPDLLFSDQLFAFLADSLGPDGLYRLDRYDVGSDVPKDCSVDEQLAFCAKHVIAWHGLHASVDFPQAQSLDDWSQMAQVQQQARQEYERCLSGDPERGPCYDRLIFPLDGVHRNASGCFLLMHRRHWEQLRGHPELHTRGHADSITCWAALSAGPRQVELRPPCLMFHQPHDRGAPSGWLQTDWRPFYERFQAVPRNGHREPLYANRPDWGLANETLEEWALQSVQAGQAARWEKSAP
jgi:hypothetical protein